MGSLEGTVVIVTGAARGIGRAIAEELGQGGAKVVVNYSHSKAPAEDLVAQLQQNGSPESVAIQADVSDAEQAARLIEDTVKRFGRIDALVNNAGINIDRTLKKMSVDDWNKVIQTDLNSCFYTVKAAQSYFIQQGRGTIINSSPLKEQRWVSERGRKHGYGVGVGVVGGTDAESEMERQRIHRPRLLRRHRGRTQTSNLRANQRLTPSPEALVP